MALPTYPGADPGGVQGVPWNSPFERASLTRDTLIEQSNRDTLMYLSGFCPTCPHAGKREAGITLFTLFHNPTELRKIMVNQKGEKKCNIEEGSNPGSQCDGPVCYRC